MEEQMPEQVRAAINSNNRKSSDDICVEKAAQQLTGATAELSEVLLKRRVRPSLSVVHAMESSITVLKKLLSASL
jgi:hypothetical protein